MELILYTKRNEEVQSLVVMGTSTGGPQALSVVLRDLQVLPHTACLIVQHMPKGFTSNLAKRLDQLSDWEISEAVDGELIQPGHAYIAPGGLQTEISVQDEKLCLSVENCSSVKGHRPSVDVLFSSVAKRFKGHMIAVLMTGMGKDGASGLHEIKRVGGYTLGEAEATCVVYGMPKAALLLGATTEMIPLSEISGTIERAHVRLNLS